MRHRWNAGACTRGHPSPTSACPERDGAKPCEPTVCSKCGLTRRRVRERNDPQSDASVPVDRPAAEYLVDGRWAQKMSECK